MGTIVEEMAERLVRARRDRRSLDAFPGELPEDLAGAYRVQEAGIAAWGEPVLGWKVALVRPDLRDRYGALRLAGPVFRPALLPCPDGGTVDVAPIPGGFAAVEAEFAFVLKADLPPRDQPYDEETVAAAVGSVHAAIEVAGSSLAGINEIGPSAVVSDQGNNAAIVLGPQIAEGLVRAPAELPARMVIDGATAGEGSAANVPGGPLAALVFLANHLTERGRHLKRGDVVSTGATTGIHPVRAGQVARAEFPGTGAISVRLV